MTVLSDLAAVVTLACETADRSDGEQRALLRVALRVDGEANAQMGVNTAMWAQVGATPAAIRIAPLSRLVDHAYATRVLADGQRPVRLPAAVEAKYRKRLARYQAEPVVEGVGG